MNQDRHSTAVVSEYVRALEDGEFDLAQRIRRANPDLEARFQMTLADKPTYLRVSSGKAQYVP